MTRLTNEEIEAWTSKVSTYGADDIYALDGEALGQTFARLLAEVVEMRDSAQRILADPWKVKLDQAGAIESSRLEDMDAESSAWEIAAWRSLARTLLGLVPGEEG